jgi:hypothetical protein
MVPIISAQVQFAVLLRTRVFAGPAAERAVELFNTAHMDRTLAADDKFKVTLLARPQLKGRLQRALNQARENSSSTLARSTCRGRLPWCRC